MELNVTKLAELSPGAALEEVHKLTAVPGIFIAFIGFSLIFLLVGLGAVKESRFKIFLIWIVSTVLSLLLIVIPLIFMPDTIQYIADIFRI